MRQCPPNIATDTIFRPGCCPCFCYNRTQQPEHITKGYVPRLACARLPGSYINHYCANGGVVVPQFGYPTDQQAIDVLQAAYGPGYKVVGVPGGTREILLNAGNVHCITQQHVLGGY